MTTKLNHENLDLSAIKNAVFQRKSIEYKKKPKQLLYTDPYFRFKRIIIELTKKVNILPHENWLDLGCNAGQFLSLIKDIFKINVTGIDDWDLKKQWTEQDYDYYSYDLNNDWTSLFPDKKFSFVSAFEVIEHIIDTDSFLKKLNGSLKKDGYLVLSTPNINCLRNRVIVPFGKYPAFLEYRNIIHHVRLYNVNILKKHVKNYGFEIIGISGVSFLPELVNKIIFFRIISEKLAQIFPSLSNNVILIAKKIKDV